MDKACRQGKCGSEPADRANADALATRRRPGRPARRRGAEIALCRGTPGMCETLGGCRNAAEVRDESVSEVTVVRPTRSKKRTKRTRLSTRREGSCTLG